MTYTFLDKNEQSLLDIILEEETVPLLTHQLKNSLREETKASVAVAFGLFSKATLYTQEMGIGKTFIAMSLLENILRANPTKKVMFCGTNDKLEEYMELFRENLSSAFPVTWTTAGELEVRSAFRELSNCRILVTTHSIWDSSHHFHKEFIPLIDEFVAIVIDEGGMLFKNQNNYAYRMMEQFVPQMKYRYILNATPIEKDLSLLVNQCRILGIPIPSKGKLFSMYGSVAEDDYKWIFSNLGELRDKLKYHIFNISRSQLDGIGKINYTLKPYLMKVTNTQQRLIYEDGAKNLRYPFKYPEYFTPNHYPSLKILINICLEGQKRGDRMLVYIRNVQPKVVIREILESLGLRVGIFDGTHTDTHEKKRRVENAFNNGEYDVLLTNKIYGLSLKIATHVIIYDLPPNFYQYIFRAIRDLNDKDLKVSVLVYDFENDYLSIKDECDSERYQNEFSDRGFTAVSDIYNMLSRKVDSNQYDG